jgi:hypothetical protein
MAGERWRWKPGGALEQIPEAEAVPGSSPSGRAPAPGRRRRRVLLDAPDPEEEVEAFEGIHVPASLGIALALPLAFLVLAVLVTPFITGANTGEILSSVAILLVVGVAALVSPSSDEPATRPAEALPDQPEADPSEPRSTHGVTHLPSKGRVTVEDQEEGELHPSEIRISPVEVDELAGECPYCGDSLDLRHATLTCPECRVPHHQDCWGEGEGCTTYGCPEGGQAEE